MDYIVWGMIGLYEYFFPKKNQESTNGEPDPEKGEVIEMQPSNDTSVESAV